MNVVFKQDSAQEVKATFIGYHFFTFSLRLLNKDTSNFCFSIGHSSFLVFIPIDT